ncbi:uncharacterized protein LOC141710810 [Apium graveolens]|uniref:uncharacterized protein LOC141710810 n=1 Tax=Apium graveolens TaxID=4045 RepID=UPI003D7AB3B8
MLGFNSTIRPQLSYANVVSNSNNGESSITHNNGGNQQTEQLVVDEVSVESNLHPLFLQNIDHPGLTLISKKLTGTENYGPWKRSITIALSAKNKLGLVNGTCPRPEVNSPLRSQWDRVNDMVISWILNTVSEEISNGMDFVTSAQEMWEELHGQFSSVNGHRVYQVLKDIHALEQGDKSVEIYYHKLKNLWDEYSVLETVNACKCGCTCGSAKLQEEREQRKKLLQFLMGLNDSYAVARGQVLMMNPLPSLSQAFSLIKQDEQQKQGRHASNSFLGVVTDTSINFQKSTNAVSNTGNGQRFFNSNKSGLKCSYCHKEGHLKENCFKLIGYPDKKKGKGKFQSQVQSNTPSGGFSGNTPSAAGFRQLPQAMNVSYPNVYPNQFSGGFPVQSQVQNNNAMLGKPQSTVSATPGSSSIEQLQTQMSQMNHMMMLMMQNKQNTPEDHMHTMAGPDSSEGASYW